MKNMKLKSKEYKMKTNLKVVIIVFSPSGSTLKTARMIEKSMTNKGMQVQLLDITRDKSIFSENKMAQYLDENIEPHDLICVGGPVYAGHFEGNAMKIIKALPYPDKKWGKLAVSFVTYGGLHSSIALTEAGKLFIERKRKNIAGMKIASFHTLTTTLPFKINKNKPEKEVLPIIEEFVSRIDKITLENNDYSKIKDVHKSFSYARPIERWVIKTLKQSFWHKKYKPVKIDYNKCKGCGLCAIKCPVNMFKMINGKPQRIKPIEDCILCAECFHNCPVGAISYRYLSKAKKRLNKMAEKMESPQSAVYPSINKIKTLTLGPTNIYLLNANNGYLLIDTSYPDKYELFVQKLNEININISEIKYLLLTHHHDDHTGFVAELVKNSGAKIIVHKAAKSYLEIGRIDQDLKGVNLRLRILLGLMYIFKRFTYPPVTLKDTDFILDDDDFNLLKETGLNGSILHTPGHSADSISLLLTDGSAFVGDAAMNMPRILGAKHKPIFIQDMTSVHNSWQKLISRGAKEIFPAHGKPFAAKNLCKEINYEQKNK